MNPRRSHRSPTPSHPSIPFSRGGAILLLFLALVLLPPPARAVVQGGEVTPPEPTVCDLVTLTVAGYVPDDCHTVRGMRVSAPELLPTAGPRPTYRISARVIVEEQSPLLGRPCVLVIQPYKESAPLGRLPFGIYWVEATEYLHPYPADASTPVDSSRVTFSFEVTQDRCDADGGCVLLGFAPTNPTAPANDGCTVRTAPGHRFCFEVTLENPMPVGGLQTEVRVGPAHQEFLQRDAFNAVAVAATPRAAGFDVSWVGKDLSATIVLFSTSGATIAPGRGPVLHVCYESNPATVPTVRYPITLGRTVVAGPRGDAIPMCPTFAPITGFVCLTGGPCDVNGDGLGDIRDIVRIVRCALNVDACPDSVRERADCNDDGSVDIRDVVCCVRRILLGGTMGQPEPGAGSDDPVRIGFEGDVRWITPVEGTATVRIEAGPTFGGIQYMVDPLPAARVRDVTLDDPLGAYALDWHAGALTGRVRVMIYPREVVAGTGAMAAATRELRVRIALEPQADAAEGGALRLRFWTSVAQDGDAVLETVPLRTEAVIPANAAVGAPSVLSVRPNPFVSGTEIVYSLPAAGRVSLRLYDVTGRLVRTLASGEAAAGLHRATWDGRDARGREAGSGVYFVRYDAAGVTRTQRLMRLR